jgi:hypothetical protein
MVRTIYGKRIKVQGEGKNTVATAELKWRTTEKKDSRE